MDYGAMEVEYIAGTLYLGVVKMYSGPGGNQGAFIAWDATTARRVWSVPERFPVWGGALATAGGGVFYGTQDGNFKAVDARTGKVLWTHHFDSGIVGNPITFIGVDVRQYGCHGGLAGGGMGPSLRDRDFEHGSSLDSLTNSILHGFEHIGMPNWKEKGMDPEEARALATYIQSLRTAAEPTFFFGWKKIVEAHGKGEREK